MSESYYFTCTHVAASWLLSREFRNMGMIEVYSSQEDALKERCICDNCLVELKLTTENLMKHSLTKGRYLVPSCHLYRQLKAVYPV